MLKLLYVKINLLLIFSLKFQATSSHLNLTKAFTYRFRYTSPRISSFASRISSWIFFLRSTRLFSRFSFRDSKDSTVSLIKWSLFKYCTVNEFSFSSAFYSMRALNYSSVFFRCSISVLRSFLRFWILSRTPAYFSMLLSLCFFVSCTI